MCSAPNDSAPLERDALVAMIESAFWGVGRSPDAVSWNETVERDHYGTEEQCKVARESDTDLIWDELVDDPSWDPFPVSGGFCFINAAGFHYYLPPTMIRILLGMSEEMYHGHLLHFIEQFTGTNDLSCWSEVQLQSIAQFILYMAHHDEDAGAVEYPPKPNRWVVALERRWSSHLLPN